MSMITSYRVKRNISFALVIVGLACIAARAWEVAMEPRSGKAWFELCGIILITYLCFDNFQIYRRKTNKPIN